MKLNFVLFLALAFSLAINTTYSQEGEEVVEDEHDFSDTPKGTFQEDEDGSQQQKQQTEERTQYVKPVPQGGFYFVETFEENVVGKTWIKSNAKKEDVEEVIAKYDGQWNVEPTFKSLVEGDQGLVLKSKAKHHAISSRLVKHFDFKQNKPLVVQYEVKFQNALECGGAYVKLLASDPKLNLEQFFDKTSFSIMFGPDKCGTENKYHFILRYKNPKNGVVEEKHAKKSELPEGLFGDGKTHLFTLIVRPDNTYSMLIDQAEVNSGSLLTDFTPAINPPKEIVDPSDKKPESWDDREKIADPDATKPEDWDENEPKQIVDESAQIPHDWLEQESPMIPDPSAQKPEDWDDETDGEWEAPKIENPACKTVPGCGKWSPPLINNPKYKGKWIAPLIENPKYQGVWEPRKIPNPDFFEDLNPFSSLHSFEAVGLELWSMTDQIYFDNFIITDDERVASQFAEDSWRIKRTLELTNAAQNSESVVSAFMKATNDKPWLWAVVLLVVLIPIVLIVVFCCGKSSPSGERAASLSADSADTKKNDEAQPDDEQDQEQEDGGAEEEEGVAAEEESAENNNEEQEEEEENEPETTSNVKNSPRKRRTRKD
jgi:calnexin